MVELLQKGHGGWEDSMSVVSWYLIHLPSFAFIVFLSSSRDLFLTLHTIVFLKPTNIFHWPTVKGLVTIIYNNNKYMYTSKIQNKLNWLQKYTHAIIKVKFSRLDGKIYSVLFMPKLSQHSMAFVNYFLNVQRWNWKTR